MKEAFNWKNTQPLLKKASLQEVRKNNLLDCRLQFIKVTYSSN